MFFYLKQKLGKFWSFFWILTAKINGIVLIASNLKFREPKWEILKFMGVCKIA